MQDLLQSQNVNDVNTVATVKRISSNILKTNSHGMPQLHYTVHQVLQE